MLNCFRYVTASHCEVNIDDCFSQPCQNDGTCTDYVNYYTCTCDAGLTGVACEIDVDECLSSPCAEDSSCEDYTNGYRCLCAAGFTGPHCFSGVDECMSTPCSNGGTCVDVVSGFHCLCPSGFTGEEGSSIQLMAILVQIFAPSRMLVQSFLCQPRFRCYVLFIIISPMQNCCFISMGMHGVSLVNGGY